MSSRAKCHGQAQENTWGIRGQQYTESGIVQELYSVFEEANTDSYRIGLMIQRQY